MQRFVVLPKHESCHNVNPFTHQDGLGYRPSTMSQAQREECVPTVMFVFVVTKRNAIVTLEQPAPHDSNPTNMHEPTNTGGTP
jgi:hypothetical protein